MIVEGNETFSLSIDTGLHRCTLPRRFIGFVEVSTPRCDIYL